LQASRRKITIFLYTVLTVVVIIGAATYAIEGGDMEGSFSRRKSIAAAIATQRGSPGRQEWA
jgi:voltage-gated potassium channel